MIDGLESPEQLCALCNKWLETNNIETDVYTPEEIIRLAWTKRKHNYCTFTIPKANGGQRTIYAPKPRLKLLLKFLNSVIYPLSSPGETAHGFVQGKNIVSNAAMHTRARYVFNIDLKDFFPTIGRGRIMRRLEQSPFNLVNTEQRPMALLISNLATCALFKDRCFMPGYKRILPQGSPLSPLISNLVCERLDTRIAALAERHNCRYSRYADDMTFSADRDIFFEGSAFRGTLKQIIEQHGFMINEAKVRVQGSAGRQDVTGLVVNENVNVKREYMKNIRCWLYFLEAYGPEKASDHWNDYMTRNGNYAAGGGEHSFMNYLTGSINYIGMVKGRNNNSFLRLKDRLEAAKKVNI